MVLDVQVEAIPLMKRLGCAAVSMRVKDTLVAGASAFVEMNRRPKRVAAQRIFSLL